MMLDYMGWKEASLLTGRALQTTIQDGTVTYDLARQMTGATEVKCSEFAKRMVNKMEKL
jgi:isocitrate dehydrogenase